MRLIHCHIEGFGGLSQFDIDFKPGLNPLLRENGFGKSTLAAFLKACFYGLSGDRRQDISENERRKYKPWNGESFGGSLSFELGDRRYRVERHFSDKKSQDYFALFNLDSGLASDDYSERLGEEIFGISAESFERTVFIGQRNFRSSMNGDIQGRLGKPGEEALGLENYESADMQLLAELNRLSPSRKTGEIYRLQMDIEELSLRIMRESPITEELLSLEERLPKLREKRAGSRKRILAAQERISALAVERDRLLMELKRQEELRGERERARLKYEKERLQREREKRDRELLYYHRSKIKAAFFRLLSFFLLLFSMVSAYFTGAGAWGGLNAERNKAFAFIILPLILAVAAFVYSHISSRGIKGGGGTEEAKEYGASETETELNPVSKASTSDVYESIESFEIKDGSDYDRVSEISRELKSFKEGGSSLSTLTESLNKENSEYERLSLELREAEERLDRLRKEHESLREGIAERERMYLRLSGLKKRYELIKITREYLGKARVRLLSRHRGPTERAFQNYYRRLLGATDGSLPAQAEMPFRMDASLELHLHAQGRERELSYLSEGYQDLLYLCRRLAVIDSIFQHEKPFLILDDPFRNLDDDKLCAALELLEDWGREGQLLYMTCSEGRSIYG